MELTYMVRGADGKDYGPVTLEQLSTWTLEGRVPHRQEVRRSDMQHWALAEDFEELQPLLASRPSLSAVPEANRGQKNSAAIDLVRRFLRRAKLPLGN